MLLIPHAPNTALIKDSKAATTWFVLASDGTGYDNLTTLAAAGKVPWPGLDAGMTLQTVTLRSEGAAAADGSAFYYAANLVNQPANDLPGELVSGGNPGFTLQGPIWNLWLRKTVSGDKVIAIGKY